MGSGDDDDKRSSRKADGCSTAFLGSYFYHKDGRSHVFFGECIISYKQLVTKPVLSLTAQPHVFYRIGPSHIIRHHRDFDLLQPHTADTKVSGECQHGQVADSALVPSIPLRLCPVQPAVRGAGLCLSLIHISEPTRRS